MTLRDLANNWYSNYEFRVEDVNGKHIGSYTKDELLNSEIADKEIKAMKVSEIYYYVLYVTI